ncbi:lipase [Phlyctema vagabunda]|uniref:Lipase n=1 Tax=Phlyctema vagabunda TaxID=108571 RepID=A0ABR4P3G0_9HELO
MRYSSISTIFSIVAAGIFTTATASPQNGQHALISSPPLHNTAEHNDGNISLRLFAELEELSRIVDISYCVGTTGIAKPFLCASRCDEFPSFELVTTFNTGPLMSDSCGYVVLDHGTVPIGHIGRRKGRIIVAFRGTYSIANTIADLSTVPQEYVPYPEEQGNSTARLPGGEKQKHHGFWDWIPRPGFRTARHVASQEEEASSRGGSLRAHMIHERKCENCTVHTGFWTSWQNTRSAILPHLVLAKKDYSEYDVHLVGHSLGGAVAALAGLELEGLGWKPVITSFGEPRVGNAALRDYIDDTFGLDGKENGGYGKRYRRVTHIDDPVPLLPLQEWGYRAHAGEVYISKGSLQPAPSDLRICFGDEDVKCSAGSEVDESWFVRADSDLAGDPSTGSDNMWDVSKADQAATSNLERRWGLPVPARYNLWQLFFAHRDYFWRLGLCLPGGDPLDWGRPHYNFSDVDMEGSKPELF